MMKFQLATRDQHIALEPEFSKWWAWFRVEHHLNTVPYHLELAARIAALEAWIMARQPRKRKGRKQ